MFDISTEVKVKVKHPLPNRRSYVELTSKDIALLLFLEKHRLVTRSQLHQLLTEYYDVPSNRTAFLNRWFKLEEFNVIASKTITLNQLGTNRKFVRLTPNGADLLKGLNLLPQDYNVAAIQSAFGRKNWDHTLAIREMVVRGLVGLKKASTNNETVEHFSYQEVMSKNPFYHPFKYPNGKSVIVSPDWLLQYQDEIACLEVDTGIENHFKIHQKIVDYLDLAAYFSDIRFSVVIGVIDNSFPTQRFYGDDRSQRVGNLKEMIVDRNDAFLKSNLDVKVCSFSRILNVIPSSFAFYPLTEDMRTQRMRFAQRFISRLPNYPYHHEAIKDIDAELDSIESVMHVRPDWVVREIDPHTNKSFLSVFVMLREGDVKSVGRLLKLSKKDGLETFFGIERVYAIYESSDELFNDMLFSKFDEHVYFSSSELLSRTEGQPYYFYKRTSFSKLEGVSY